VLTSLFSSNYTINSKGQSFPGGTWRNVEGEKFLFYDQSAREPGPLKTVVDENYLSSGAQITGIVLSSLAVACALATASWVLWKRKVRVVTASQPEFLYLLCFGASLVGSSVLFLSFDEDKGWSESQLTAACKAFPWFFVIGYLTMYCSLFCKLWRLSKLLEFRRRAVHIRQVMWPFAAIIASSIIVLIVWTAVDPLVWNRSIIQDHPLERYGECRSANYGELPFILPLAVLIAITMVMAATIAWKLRDVQPDLAESRWIFSCILMHLQSWLVGIPLIIITDGVSKDAEYIMFVALAFVFSVSSVAFVIWPKIYMVYTAGRTTRATAVISIQQGQTRISGFTDSNFKKSEITHPETTAGHDLTHLRSRMDQEVRSLRSSVPEDTSSVENNSLPTESPPQVEKDKDVEVAQPIPEGSHE